MKVLTLVERSHLFLEVASQILLFVGWVLSRSCVVSLTRSRFWEVLLFMVGGDGWDLWMSVYAIFCVSSHSCAPLLKELGWFMVKKFLQLTAQAPSTTNLLAPSLPSRPEWSFTHSKEVQPGLLHSRLMMGLRRFE